MTAGLYGKYWQNRPHETCAFCSREIMLRRFGNHFKWVTGGTDWQCGNDPAFPVRGHKPKEANE